jgi:hypothetical protein
VQGPLLGCHRTGKLIVDIDEGRIHELRFLEVAAYYTHDEILNLSATPEYLGEKDWILGVSIQAKNQRVLIGPKK